MQSVNSERWRNALPEGRHGVLQVLTCTCGRGQKTNKHTLLTSSEVSEVIRRVLHHSISAGDWVKGLMNLADSVKKWSIGGNAPQVHESRDHWITTHEIISDRILFTTERCNAIYSVDSVRENVFHYYKRKTKLKSKLTASVWNVAAEERLALPAMQQRRTFQQQGGCENISSNCG